MKCSIPYSSVVVQHCLNELILHVFWLIYADSINLPPEKSKPWWLNEKVKLKLAHIYRAKGMLEDFVDAVFPLVRESLYVETLHPKVIMRHQSNTLSLPPI